MSIVTGTLTLANGSAYVGDIVFRPLSTPLAASPNLVISPDIKVTTDAEGDFSVSLAVGEYKVYLGLADTLGLWISVPDDSLSYSILSLINNTLPFRRTEPPYDDRRLLEMAEAGAWELLTTTYDASYRITGGTVKWPDGSAGVLTINAWDTDGQPNGWSLTHTTAGRTITQPTMTRNAQGDITTKPALTIA